MCNQDSCTLLTEAIFTDKKQLTRMFFSLYKSSSKNELIDSSGHYRFDSKSNFASGIDLGDLAFCDGSTFPCLSVLYIDDMGTQWSTDFIPQSEVPLNNDPLAYVRISKIESYDVNDPKANEALSGQLSAYLSYGRGNHIIYIDADFRLKVYNTAGEAKEFTDARVRTMFVN